MTMDIPATMKAVVFDEGSGSGRSGRCRRRADRSDRPAGQGAGLRHPAARTTRSCSTRPARTPRPA